MPIGNAANMVKRQPIEHYITGTVLVQEVGAPRARQQIAMGEHNTLRRARAARSETEKRHIIWLDGAPNEPARLVDELAALKPDVIMAGNESRARVALDATRTIPIVLGYSGDPVAGEFARSLARPGGNVTGISTLNADSSGKMLELLLTAVPKLPRVAVLGNPAVPSYPMVLKNFQDAAGRLGVNVLSVEVRSAAEIEEGIARIAQEKLKAVVVLGDTLVFVQRQQIADLAIKYRLASVYPAREHVDAGGLLSYGTNVIAGYRRAASFVDRILKGAKPGDLPIEQATKLELVISMKTAKALGIAIPQSLLVRADEVIQ